MALSYLFSTFSDQDEIASEVQTNSLLQVTYTGKMRNAFDDRGLTKVYESQLSMEDVKSLNAQGYPIIILLYFDITHQFQHYVLITGYNGSGIFANDPWPTSWAQPQGRETGANVFISENQLDDLWSCTPSYWGLVIPYSQKIGTPIEWLQQNWLLIIATLAIIITGTISFSIWVRRRKGQRGYSAFVRASA